MSRIYENGYRIVYPNELAYAGMPAIVRVSNLDASYLGVGLTIQVGDAYYSEVRTLHNGEATFDISRYMQLAFDGKPMEFEFGTRNQIQKNNLAQDVSVVVQLSRTNGSDTALQFNVKALLGYIAYGQTNGGVRYRKLFANYPQTFDFYCTPSTDISLVFDGGDAQVITYRDDITRVEQLSVELSRWWSVPEDARTAVLAANNTLVLNGDNVVEGDSEYRLTIDRCKSGVFLRWLDHFGQWCYYLFRTTGQNFTTKEVNTWQNGELRNSAEPSDYVVQSSDFLQQQLSQQHTLSLGAKLVDADTFDFLLSLTSSPRVEMLINAEEYQDDNTTTPIWERVNIVAGSYARTGAPLQDFVVSIAATAKKTQML